MNVGELIEQLQRMDTEMPVLFVGSTSGYPVLKECPAPETLSAYYDTTGGWNNWSPGSTPAQTVCVIGQIPEE